MGRCVLTAVRGVAVGRSWYHSSYNIMALQEHSPKEELAAGVLLRKAAFPEQDKFRGVWQSTYSEGVADVAAAAAIEQVSLVVPTCRHEGAEDKPPLKEEWHENMQRRKHKNNLRKLVAEAQDMSKRWAESTDNGERKHLRRLRKAIEERVEALRKEEALLEASEKHMPSRSSMDASWIECSAAPVAGRSSNPRRLCASAPTLNETSASSPQRPSSSSHRSSSSSKRSFGGRQGAVGGGSLNSTATFGASGLNSSGRSLGLLGAVVEESSPWEENVQLRKVNKDLRRMLSEVRSITKRLNSSIDDTERKQLLIRREEIQCQVQKARADATAAELHIQDVSPVADHAKPEIQGLEGRQHHAQHRRVARAPRPGSAEVPAAAEVVAMGQAQRPRSALERHRGLSCRVGPLAQDSGDANPLRPAPSEYVRPTRGLARSGVSARAPASTSDGRVHAWGHGHAYVSRGE